MNGLTTAFMIAPVIFPALALTSAQVVAPVAALMIDRMIGPNGWPMVALTVGRRCCRSTCSRRASPPSRRSSTATPTGASAAPTASRSKTSSPSGASASRAAPPRRPRVSSRRSRAARNLLTT
eukprot:5236550-Prymnesium_polylepis.5